MFTKVGTPVPVTVTDTMDPEPVTGSITGVFLQENHDNSRPLPPRIQKIKTIMGKPVQSIEDLSQLWSAPNQNIEELSRLFGDSTEITISHKLPVTYTDAQPIPRGYEGLTPEILRTGVNEIGEIGMMTQSSMVRAAAQNLEQSIIAKNKEIKVMPLVDSINDQVDMTIPDEWNEFKYKLNTQKSEQKRYWGASILLLKSSPRFQELYHLYSEGSYDRLHDLYKVVDTEWKALKAAEDAAILPAVNIGKLPVKSIEQSDPFIDAGYPVEEMAHPKTLTVDEVVSVTQENVSDIFDALFGNSTVLDMVEDPKVNPSEFCHLTMDTSSYELPLDKASDEDVARLDTRIQDSIGALNTASVEEILTSKIFDPLCKETVASITNQMVTDLIIQPFLQATPPTLPMSLNVYQYLAGRTANRDLTPTTSLMVAALGLTGEAGEVADIVKKVAGHGHALDGALRVKLQKEIGDVMWYIAELCTQLDITMEETAYENVKKLKARYPEGFSSYRSINRVE
jgi:NTP pyrophosphatase (non-canonical NTP hydrolase)